MQKLEFDLSYIMNEGTKSKGNELLSIVDLYLLTGKIDYILCTV